MIDEIDMIRLDIGNRYHEFVQIAQGSFSVVFRALDKSTQKRIVIKMIRKDYLQNDVYAYVIQEVQLLRKSDNTNIIKLLDNIETNNNIYMILEYCAMDLQMLWEDQFQCTIPETYAILILRQVVNGFSELHKNHVIHRDIKLENIVVSIPESAINQLRQRQFNAIYSAVFKIADLGLSKQLTQQNELTQTYAGSPLSMAPEILEGKSYGIQSDMYSLGVMLYQMLFGCFPFDAQSSQQQIDIVRRGNPKMEFDGIKISKTMEQLLRAMLQYNPSIRISWIDLYNHQFFANSTFDLISQKEYKRNKTVYLKLLPKQNQQPQIQAINENVITIEEDDYEDDDDQFEIIQSDPHPNNIVFDPETQTYQMHPLQPNVVDQQGL